MSFPTWSDLNDQSLIPPLGERYAPDLGQVALMVSTDPDFRYIASSCSNRSTLPFFLGNLFTINSGESDINDGNGQKVSVAGPYLGSPCAAMILESLIARGVSKVLVVGWCGAISDELKVGDILIPDAAICDEGTSRNYMEMPTDTNFPTIFPHSHFTSKVKILIKSQLAKNYKYIDENTGLTGADDSTNRAVICKSGKIWTTDAIYRETAKKVAFFREMGAVAVEMECSALFAVAQYRKIDIAAILVVSDSLDSPQWKPGFKEPAFKTSRKRVLNTIKDIINNLTVKQPLEARENGKIYGN